MKYQYDANGRQWWSAPISNQTNAAVAVYDGVGQRVQATVAGVTTLMVYDIFGQLVAEYGGPSSVGAGGVQYVLSDLQGSTRAVLNDDGAVMARHDYQAFGAEIGAGTGKRTSGQRYSVTDSTRQRYAGMERDASGTDHTWFRQYESSAGRWTSPDPYGESMSVGEPQSFNRYSYVHNDPVNFVDPSGLQEKQCVDSHGNPVKCPDETDTTLIQE